MIDSERFDKRDIIEWEERTNDMKTWSNATKYFQKLVANKETYANLVGSTATKRSDERDGSKITRTLPDNTMGKGWHSSQESTFATNDNTTPQSKTGLLGLG